MKEKGKLRFTTLRITPRFPWARSGRTEVKRLASLSPGLGALPVLFLHCLFSVRDVTVPVFQCSPRVLRQSASNQARQVGPGAGAAKVSKISEGFFSAEAGSSVLLPPPPWPALH